MSVLFGLSKFIHSKEHSNNRSFQEASNLKFLAKLAICDA